MPKVFLPAGVTTKKYPGASMSQWMTSPLAGLAASIPRLASRFAGTHRIEPIRGAEAKVEIVR